MNIEDLHSTFQKWLELDGDTEFLDVALAARCDRKLSGDPVWFFLIGNSGACKTETIRALNDSDNDTYALDSLTAHTLISGKVTIDENGQPTALKGILPELDGKVLLIKDFTIILSKREEERTEIFSQLRGLHDGYLEFAYGTTNKPVRIKADIGLIAATTPAIDMYGKLSTLLGERFLKIRHTAKPKQTSERAARNLGSEVVMREELRQTTADFLSNISFKPVPVTDEQCDFIIDLATLTATLRTPVMMRLWRYEEQESFGPNIEYPTRLTKQFLKLSMLLANIRGHTEITYSELKAIQRVARDTCVPNRIKIIDFVRNQRRQCTTREIADGSDLPLATCWRDLKELEYLRVVDYEQVDEAASTYGKIEHKPAKDGWVLKQPNEYDKLFGEIPIFVSQSTTRVGMGVEVRKEEVNPVVVSETALKPVVATETGACDTVDGES